MVQLDHDVEMEPMHEMYRTLEAELEVQRTIKRAELMAFSCLLRNAIGLTMVHVDNKGIIDGLWILIWEELHRLHQEGILVEVEHVKAHRTKKEMQQMSLFERFIAEGNEKADKLAKEGTMTDGGRMAQVRASTVQQGGEEVYAALQYAASFHCLVEEWRDVEELKPTPKEK